MIRIVRTRTLDELAEDTAQIPGLRREASAAASQRDDRDALLEDLCICEPPPGQPKVTFADGCLEAPDRGSRECPVHGEPLHVIDELRIELRAERAAADDIYRDLAAARERIEALEAAAQDDLTATVLAARDLALEAAGFIRIGWARDEADYQRKIAGDALAVEKFICAGCWDADLPGVKIKIAAIRRALSDIRARGAKLDRVDTRNDGTYYRSWKESDYGVDKFLATAGLYYCMLTGQDPEAALKAAVA